MAACSMIYKLICVLVAGMLVASVPYAQALTCNNVYTSLYPCLSYISGNGGPVPIPCCTGIKSLNAAAKTTPDRQTVCRCLTQIAKGATGINTKLIASLPSQCRVYIPYTLSPNIDCSKIRS
ncbi:Non-specific lipid-transfer protein [Thalictrum thalictroides]|uniref:Non-specific lipid-transfer protein n=1 Tax=Thalictrum thalictroides TaxID=46969 RepID=A0A7J6WXK2_THATH|nr:Non-specific lipid-transfer protein [Thalictrum thalictroides]